MSEDDKKSKDDPRNWINPTAAQMKQPKEFMMKKAAGGLQLIYGYDKHNGFYLNVALDQLKESICPCTEDFNSIIAKNTNRSFGKVKLEGTFLCLRTKHQTQYVSNVVDKSTMLFFMKRFNVPEEDRIALGIEEKQEGPTTKKQKK